jgi:alpha-1,2-mannosyltransferase
MDWVGQVWSRVDSLPRPLRRRTDATAAYGRCAAMGSAVTEVRRHDVRGAPAFHGGDPKTLTVGGKSGTAVRHWLGLVVLAGAVAAFVVVSARWHGQFDFRVYHGAVSSWLRGGELYAYEQPGQVRAYGFTYPPFAALVMAPITAVQWPVGAAALAAASVAGTLALLWLRFRQMVPMLAGITLLAAAEPWRDTLSLGQLNIVLLVLVAFDLLVLLGRHPAAGVCIGLAASIKLTPALFVGYLLVTSRYRAALVAAGTMAGTTALAWLVAPDASYTYWTDLLWRTERVGDLAFVSNQSLAGVVARLGSPHPGLWPVLVVAVLAGWAWRARQAGKAGDEWAGFALTGVAMCLVSPVSWIHHLVWQVPALLVLVDAHVTRRQRLSLRLVAAGVYALMATRVVWLFKDHVTGWAAVGANMHVLGGLMLLCTVPIGPSPGHDHTAPARKEPRRES